MLVHALRGAGLRPGLAGRRAGRRRARQRATGATGEWLVVEADESDRSMLSLDVEIAVLTNVELDHHATFASLARAARGVPRVPGRRARRRSSGTAPSCWRCARRPSAVAYDAAERSSSTRRRLALSTGAGTRCALAVPGAHNALNAAGGAGGGAAGGRRRAPRDRRARRLPRRRAALPAARRERAAGARVYDDYAHHPTEVAATLAGGAHARAERLVAVFQPHLYSRTRAARARVRRARWRAADVVVVLDVYPARERAEDFPGVSGLLIAEAAADAARRAAGATGCPTFDDAERVLRGAAAARATCAW